MYISTTVQCQIESLERNVREKTIEVKQLQKQNADLERARHTEVIKLRLEVYRKNVIFKTVCHSISGITQYDAKLLKFQKQSARNQAPQSSSFNNEIFRKVGNVLVWCMTESCKEIVCGDVETATCQSRVWEGDRYTTEEGGRTGKTAVVTATTNHKEEKNLLN